MDASQEPEWFTKLLKRFLAISKAGINISDVDYFELNELFQ